MPVKLEVMKAFRKKYGEKKGERFYYGWEMNQKKKKTKKKKK